MSRECEIHDHNMPDGRCTCPVQKKKRKAHSSAPAGSAAASDAEKELTPMDDALLMLDLWDTAIRKHIKVQPGSPIHRLVKETIQRLKQPNNHSVTPVADLK